MTESWLQSYARQIVFEALGRIQHGQLTAVSEYQGAAMPVAVFGQPPTKGKEDDEDIAVVVRDPNAWTRVCQAFDLVRHVKTLLEWAIRINREFPGVRRSLHNARG